MKLRSLKAKARRLSGCDGKVRFRSFTRAQSVAKRQSQRHGLKFQAYSCACGYFHTGSTHQGGTIGVSSNTLQPFRLFAHNGDGVECFIGRAPDKEGGDLAKIMKRDGWTVTRVV